VALSIGLLFCISEAPSAMAQTDGVAIVVQAQPEGQAHPTSVADEAQKAEKASEEDETAAFRHSATVQWFARLFHTDVETTAKIFEYFNFLVIVLALGIPLFRALPKIMRKRSAKLGAELEVARAKTEDANDRLRAIETKLAGLDQEISAFRKQVEEDMRADEVRNKAAIEEETARIVAAAEQEIVMAGTHAQRGLKQFAADLAIDRAMSQLTLDAATDRALIEEFAHDVAGKNSGRRKQSGEGSRN
jgi:F-type H+-transporting ATPase subunit b